MRREVHGILPWLVPRQRSQPKEGLVRVFALCGPATRAEPAPRVVVVLVLRVNVDAETPWKNNEQRRVLFELLLPVENDSRFSYRCRA